MDESVFVYDSIVRRVWGKKGSRPRVITTGSHKKVFEFGSVALIGSTLFRSYDSMTSREFKGYLNALKRKYGRYTLFYYGAPWHKSDDVENYLKMNKRKIIPVRFPVCSPELNPVEECWNQGKNAILGSSVPATFDGMKRRVSEYYRTRRFKINIINYLCP
ncbi:MAG: transposase [Candidatus Parvarchaeota archaeon]